MSYYYPNFDSRDLLDAVERAIGSNEFNHLSQQIASIVNGYPHQTPYTMDASYAQTAQPISSAQYASANQAAYSAQYAQQTWQQATYGAQGYGFGYDANAQNATYHPQTQTNTSVTQGTGYVAPSEQTASSTPNTAHYAESVRNTAQSQFQAAQQTLTAHVASTNVSNMLQRPKRRAQKALATAQSIAGYTGAATFGLTAAGAVSVMIDEGFDIIALAFAIFAGIGFAACARFGMKGSRTCKLMERFKLYEDIVGKRTSCSIDELSYASGYSSKNVVKDLKEMIRRGLFPQGSLDDQKQILFVTTEARQQHALAMQQADHQAQLDAAEAARQQQLPAVCRDILAEGKQYIQFIHHANDVLPSEEISAKLDRLESIITRIFSEVEKNPSAARDLKKLMNYYLPTTKKLVQTYIDLENEPIPSEKMHQTKQEIEDALVVINQAFETLLDDLFHDTALDISSDIQVLNTMLAQEGLANNGFGTIK